MKLYYSPGACSFSPHIVLHEAGIEHELVKVDLKAHQTETGEDFYQINPKGSVPVLELDNGERLTEGPAIVQYIADQVPEKNLAPKAGTMERYRLMEMLNFITSELHKGFGPLFNPQMPNEAKTLARQALHKKFGFVNEVLAKKGPYLFGEAFCVADAYLYTITTWAKSQNVELSEFEALTAFTLEMEQRESVKHAKEMEQGHKMAA